MLLRRVWSDSSSRWDKSLSIHFGPVENRPHLSILRECVDREIIWNLKLKAESQYNFLRRDMRFATHATSCGSDTRFTIFMFATASCAQVVLCTCTARAPRVETVLHFCMSRAACRKSWTFFNFCDRCIATACDSSGQAVSCRNCRKSRVASQKVVLWIGLNLLLCWAY